MEESQQVPYVGLPVTDKVALREVRFEVGKAHAEWVAAWHAQMYVLARQGSRFGSFTTTLRSFVDSYGGYVPDPRDGDHFEGWSALCVQLWESFERHGLVELDGDPSDHSTKFRVTVVHFGETNVPRPSGRPRTSADVQRRAKDAERKRKARADKRARIAGMSAASADASADVRPNRSEDSRSEKPEIAKVSTPSRPPVDNSTDGLTFDQDRRETRPTSILDDSTAYEIDRLMDSLSDADDGTRGVLEHLARSGAGPADFADAREAIRACHPSKPSGYAVRTIRNRLAQPPTIGATA